MRTRLMVMAAAFAVLIAGTLAATPTASAATTDGTLTAISGITPPAILTMQSGTTVYTVNVSATTKLVRLYGGPSTLDEFAVGDLLRVEGTTTGTTIEATKIKNLSIQRKGAAQWGKVLTIDASAKSFTFDPMHNKHLDNQTVLTNSKTKVFQGNRAGTFEDLKAGMTVKVIGVWRKSQDQLVAERILIKLTELNGLVTAVDCAASPKTITVETQSKMKEMGKFAAGLLTNVELSSTLWTVSLTDDTVLRDRAMNPIACADVKVGHKVQVRGLRTGSAALNALSVIDKGAKRTAKEWEGRIASIDADAKSFVLDLKEKDDVVVLTVAETIIVDEDGKATTFDKLAVGHKLHVRGTLSGSSVTANLIIDQNLP